MKNPQTVIYTRKGCHLCEEARDLLVRYGLAPEMVDIDQNPRLAREYTNWAPVVTIDGRVRFRGRVQETLLRRILAGASQPPGTGS